MPSVAPAGWPARCSKSAPGSWGRIIDTLDDGLRFGAIGDADIHLCIDMQEVFARETPWHVPWAHRTAPSIRRRVRYRPERTVFTRFLPPERPDDMPGTWRRFYTRWAEMTRGEIEPALLDLVPMLAEFVPPALVFDKHGHSAFTAPDLGRRLRDGGVDRGYRVVLAADGVCSTSAPTTPCCSSVAAGSRSRLRWPRSI